MTVQNATSTLTFSIAASANTPFVPTRIPFGTHFSAFMTPSGTFNEPIATSRGVDSSETLPEATTVSRTLATPAPSSDTSSSSLISNTQPTANVSKTPNGGGNFASHRDITIISALLGSLVLVIAIVTMVLYRRIIRRAVISKLYKNAEFLSAKNIPGRQDSLSLPDDVETGFGPKPESDSNSNQFLAFH